MAQRYLFAVTGRLIQAVLLLHLLYLFWGMNFEGWHCVLISFSFHLYYYKTILPHLPQWTLSFVSWQFLLFCVMVIVNHWNAIFYVVHYHSGSGISPISLPAILSVLWSSPLLLIIGIVPHNLLLPF